MMQTLALAALATVTLLARPAAAFGPAPPKPSNVYSLSPRFACGERSPCYQGTEKELEQVAATLPGVCNTTLLRPGNCSIYAYPLFQKDSFLFPNVKLYTESKGPHLWFYHINGNRCGEVDAAPRMPLDIFEPKNAASLEIYTKATLTAYFPTVAPPFGKKMGLGRCADNSRYTAEAGVLPKVSWIGNLGDQSGVKGQARVCSTYCGCKLTENDDNDDESCKDVPDKPESGRFCSLCGPKFNARISISVYVAPPTPPPPPTPAPPPPPAPPQCDPAKGCNVCAACCEAYIPAGKQCNACVAQKCTGPPPSPPGPSNTIVDLAIATPDLSTLVTALKAADLVATLSGPGPFTVFAPQNEAFAALPAGVLNTLLKPENKDKLVKVLTYHVVSGNIQAKDLKDGEKVKTVEGEELTVRIAGSAVFINSAKVSTADVEASNGVVHIIDGVLLPQL